MTNWKHSVLLFSPSLSAPSNSCERQRTSWRPFLSFASLMLRTGHPSTSLPGGWVLSCPYMRTGLEHTSQLAIGAVQPETLLEITERNRNESTRRVWPVWREYDVFCGVERICEKVWQIFFLCISGLCFLFCSETFSFVLTGEDGSRRFGYCRRLLVTSQYSFPSCILKREAPLWYQCCWQNL